MEGYSIYIGTASKLCCRRAIIIIIIIFDMAVTWLEFPPSHKLARDVRQLTDFIRLALRGRLKSGGEGEPISSPPAGGGPLERRLRRIPLKAPQKLPYSASFCTQKIRQIGLV